MLECGHTACPGCVRPNKTGTKLICPSCSRMQAMPDNEVNGLRRNILKETGEQPAEAAERLCTACSKPARFTCTCTNVHFCDEHAPGHQEHCRKGMIAVSLQQTIDDVAMCPVHQG